jgi:hypothetical protein
MTKAGISYVFLTTDPKRPAERACGAGETGDPVIVRFRSGFTIELES